LLALAMSVGLVVAACSDDDDDSGVQAGGGGTTASGQTGASTSSGDTATGGELIDLGTNVGDPPEHIDPALNVTLDAYQIVNMLYDGLTDVDTQTDPENPTVKGLVAESFTPNADATVWTFKIKQGLTFSNGEPVTPTSFSRAWERASNKDFAGDYSYLFNFIKGGKEKLAGTATTLEGVKADDATMTLTVTLAKPYSNFATVAGFQLFSPMPSDVDKLSDQNSWENGLMIGNGPYMLESPRNDQEIVVVKNPKWGGDIYGNKSANLDKITFKTSADPDTSYNAFEAGEGDTANVPPGRAATVDKDHASTQNVHILGSYHFEIKWDDPVVGGPDNKLLREAISQAVDRDAINQAVYSGVRTISTGITPEGIPGWKSGLCLYCKTDKAAAQKAFDDWKAAGHSLTAPIKIQVNANSGHEQVVQIMIDNLKGIGIDAVADPLPSETYFSELSKGACQICRSGWYADYPTYDNFMYDLFSTDAIGGNNHGFYSNPKFDDLVAQAKATTDAAKQASLFQQAEQVLLNDDVGVIPLNWYVGDYAYNPDKIASFPQSNLGLVAWDRITLKK
jgi:oligopeptide transport system substrate-binding protein